MAEKEAIFNLKVNTGNSINDVKKFDKAIKSLDKSVEHTYETVEDVKAIQDLEKRLTELNKMVDSGTLTWEEATKAVEAYKSIALQTGSASPIGQEAIDKSAQLRDQMTDLDNRVNILSSDYVNLETALSSISVGASIFQGLASVTTLVGHENEDLMKTMMKLQAVMGITNAIHQVSVALNKDSLLGMRLRIGVNKILTFIKGQETSATAKNVAVQQADIVGTGILAGAKRVLAKATLSSATAMKVLKGAIVSTGIGALVLLLIEGISMLLSFGDASEEAEEQQERFNQSVERSNERIDKFNQSTDRQLKKQLLQLKLRGVSEERYNEGVRRGAIQNLEKKKEMIQIELKMEMDKISEMKRLRKVDMKDAVRIMKRTIELKENKRKG